MIQFYNNQVQLADFLSKFGIDISSIDLKCPNNYGLIKVSGKDAAIFLQKQLTCDVNIIDKTPILGAICNVQGRVESIFKIYKLFGDFYIQIIKELLTLTINNLKKYVLRSKIIFQEIQEINEQSNLNNKDHNILWEIQEISQKMPEIYLTTTEKFLPHNINLLKLNAVSLNKGCYKGQAIIARMQYLSKIKKELKIISIDNIQQIFIPGDKLKLIDSNSEATIVRTVIINQQYQLALIETAIVE